MEHPSRYPILRTVGDRGLLVEYGNAISSDTNHKVRAMAVALGRKRPVGVNEVVPTYCSLLVVYDPELINPFDLREMLADLERGLSEMEIPASRTVEIPVAYGGDFGPDIGFVAERNGLTVDDVIRIHSAAVYQIHMIGFTPGFPFLGGLPEILHAPRLETPRTLVPAGSVGIANGQTGIYPLESPGGWRLIGRSPLVLFDPNRPEPFLYKAGDEIRFIPISRGDFQRMSEGRER